MAAQVNFVLEVDYFTFIDTLFVMAEKRKRSQNFTVDEKDKLVKLVYEYKNVILNKKTDGTTNQAKNEAWLNLCTKYNATGNMYRSKDALMRVWEKMKSEAKMYNSRNRNCTIGTGGGPSTSKTDPIMDQVCNLMGRGCSGIADVLDSDSVITITNMAINEDVVEDECEESQAISLDASLQRDSGENMTTNEDVTEDEFTVTPSCSKIPTPIWRRRRPLLKEQNHPQSEVVSALCTGFQDINKKRTEIEELKMKILEEELNFKRSLYNLQLESARKDLEIKIVVLNQIKGGNFNVKNLFEVPKND